MKKGKNKELLKDILKSLGIAVCFVAVFLCFFSVGHMVGDSMSPTHDGKNIYIGLRKQFANIERYDIIDFYSETLDETLIKRVVGLPGDHVVVDDCTIYINGEKLDEPYMADIPETQSTAIYQYTDVVLGEDEYFVCGDNRRYSGDSRNFGPIKYEDIISKKFFVF